MVSASAPCHWQQMKYDLCLRSLTFLIAKTARSVSMGPGTLVGTIQTKVFVRLLRLTQDWYWTISCKSASAINASNGLSIEKQSNQTITRNFGTLINLSVQRITRKQPIDGVCWCIRNVGQVRYQESAGLHNVHWRRRLLFLQTTI